MNIEPKVEQFGGSAVRVIWADMKLGDVGVASTFARYQDRSIQVFGDFGVGGALQLKGSNDNEHFVPLSDPRGNDFTIRQPKLEQIEDCTYAIQPVVVEGDATTSLTVVLFARKEE